MDKEQDKKTYSIEDERKWNSRGGSQEKTKQQDEIDIEQEKLIVLDDKGPCILK